MTQSVAAAFEGVLCPLVTPFEDDTVDESALAAHVDRLHEVGMDGFVPAGTTGELASLTDAEYRIVLETTAEAAGDAPVMAGAAHTTVPGALDRIETAAAAGADAALVPLPYYHGANDPAGNEAFLSAVADDAALPVYLYNIPACAGQAIAPETLETVSRHENVLGLKDSNGDLDYFLAAARRTPDEFRLYQGYDSHLVPGLVMGATGGINALSNAIPEAFVAARDAVAAGDIERARHVGTERIAPLFQACAKHGFAPATKAALVARGWMDGQSVRPPLVPLDADATAEIEASVERALADD